MKKLLMLSVCLVACGAMAARADVIVTEVTTPGVLPGLDEIDCVITGITNGANGADAGYLVNGIEGSFTVTGGTMFLPSASSSQAGAGLWATNMLAPTGFGNGPPYSYANFTGEPVGNLAMTSPVYLTSPTPKHFTATAVFGSWTSTGGGDWLSTSSDPTSTAGSPDNFLATIIVSSGATVNYSGQVSISRAGGTVESLTFGPVPEPGTLVLLATGLMGLVAYAWRKRK